MLIDPFYVMVNNFTALHENSFSNFIFKFLLSITHFFISNSIFPGLSLRFFENHSNSEGNW